nr:MAG TPA: hypothetical protein [Caudoviricetes sp.]
MTNGNALCQRTKNNYTLSPFGLSSIPPHLFLFVFLF